MELVLLSLSLNFIYFGAYYNDPKGQIFALLLLGIAASEAVIGLTLLIIASKAKENISTIMFKNLNG